MKTNLKNIAKSALFGMAIAGFTAPMAQAKGYAYKCTTTHSGSHGWVAPDMILAFDDETLVGSAYDGFIHGAHKAPIPVALKKESDIRYRFRWKIEVTPSNSSSTMITYTVRLYPGRKTFSLSARLHGFDNSIGGQGTCVLLK